ncbi:MAG: TetR/AcrR family transcriptional regulator [Pseudonocardiaceae bacterium]|nr:TetR/AcrR family transcriptional regulator [Pseudonocardiaceae bacterium]
MRGLTHRAVDRAADLPVGSTSYYARTRAALLELAMARMVESDVAEASPVPELSDVDAFSQMVAEFLHATITGGRARMLARYEFALEATRRPELRAIYDRAGARLREPAVALLMSAGSVEPERQARALISFCEGILFDSIAGLNHDNPPGAEELRDGVRELLNGMLARPPAGEP